MSTYLRKFSHFGGIFAILASGAGLIGCAPVSEESLTDCVAQNDYFDGTPIGINGPSTISGAVAQSFVSRKTGTIGTVQIRLLTVKPSPSTIQSGTLTLSLETDLSASPGAAPTQPSNSALGLEAKSIADLNLSATVSQLVTFTVNSTVASNVAYWIVLRASYSPNSTSYVTWVGSAADKFATGFPLVYDALHLSWTNNPPATGQDQYFRAGCTN